MKSPAPCCCSAKTIEDEEPSFFRQHCSGRRWSNATGGSFSLFPRSSSSIVHQLCPKAISAPTLPNIIHTTKTRPLWEDGKGFWGGWRGRGGYQSIADNHSVWPQPCNAWPTSNVYIFSVFFLFATLVNCPCFVANFSTTSATLSYFSALQQLKFDKNTLMTFRQWEKILFGSTHFHILWNYITQIIYDTVVHIANVLWLGNAEKRSVRIQRQRFVWLLSLPERPKCFCFLKAPAYWVSTQND